MSLRVLFPDGTVINERYEIVRQIGAGGYSLVFEARDHTGERDVALKLLDLVGLREGMRRYEEFVQRFEREVQTLSKLSSAHIVALLDSGIERSRGVPFLVMELLRGETVYDYVKESGPFAPGRLWRLFLPLLDALGGAHRKGIVHKDLNPSNIFLSGAGTREEELSILDFGSAYWMEAIVRLTSKNAFVGTPRYIPPEYSDDQVVTPALDVYQMALVLIEMLSGEPAVRADNRLAALFAHSKGDLVAPAALASTPLWSVLQCALSRDVGRRYANAAAFAAALRAIDPGAIPTCAPGDPPRRLSD